ncbi:hypothetical protein [uncultured Xylophilus sp.]|uniref:hypothetical protein n=1 Tax=uncultured Xylophilus sp. TaxID=296832 RepID=UPI0025FB1469|nr:hypothetical protein [uncultured Xylophilus sp.]
MAGIARAGIGAGLVLAALLSAGCASQRISSALERYGVPPDKADCVGDSLAERLTFAQLQSLSKAARAYRVIGNDGVTMTLFDLARVGAELRDPVIPLEVVRAGVRCTVLPPGSAYGR